MASSLEVVSRREDPPPRWGTCLRTPSQARRIYAQAAGAIVATTAAAAALALAPATTPADGAGDDGSHGTGHDSGRWSGRRRQRPRQQPRQRGAILATMKARKGGKKRGKTAFLIFLGRKAKKVAKKFAGNEKSCTFATSTNDRPAWRIPGVKTTIKMKNLLLSVLAIAAANPAGFTVSLQDLSTPVAGYAVAAAETQNSFGDSGLADVLILAPALGAQYVGGWRDEKTGKYYFDATFVVEDREKAIELGRKNGQIAIFDLAAGDEIRL